jgi:uncharacterized membrane protein YkvA (DUF1232 family)
MTDRPLVNITRLRDRARRLKRETVALYLACRDPRTPWLARAVAGAVVAYALCPIDLIPDFVPVLGYLDDLVLVPAGLLLALRLVPPAVMADCRVRAQSIADRPTSRTAAAVVVALWIGAALLTAYLAARLLGIG